jgi:hypothetical protein
MVGAHLLWLCVANRRGVDTLLQAMNRTFEALSGSSVHLPGKAQSLRSTLLLSAENSRGLTLCNHPLQ